MALSIINNTLSASKKYDECIPEFKKALLRLAMAIVVVNEEITNEDEVLIEDASYNPFKVSDEVSEEVTSENVKKNELVDIVCVHMMCLLRCCAEGKSTLHGDCSASNVLDWST